MLAFEELYRVPADIGKYTDDGMTEPEVARLTFRNVTGREPSRAELARLLSARLRYLPRTVAESKTFKVLPGVETTLEQLHKSGYLLGIVTGGMEAAAHIKLARANLGHYFCFGGYGSDSEDRAELTRRALERAGKLLGGALDPKEAVTVGDTPHDVEAAHSAGTVAVGIASGHYTKKALEEAQADYVLGSLEEPFPLARVPEATR